MGSARKETTLLTDERPRSRAIYALLIVVTIVLGMGSRRFGFLLPALIRKPTGDVLWATMVFFLIGLLFPHLSRLRCAALAAAFSIVIEFGKFLHAPWLDAIRDTTLGRLVFGYAFSWANLAYYLLGIALGFGIETLLAANQKEPNSGLLRFAKGAHKNG